MKKIYLSILASMFLAFGYATNHTVTNVGQTFSPDSLTIQVGDSIDFTIGGSHDVQQYETKWFDDGSLFASNNTTSNGFELPLGGGMLGHMIFFIPGTYYYVCEPHFDNGMKAKIVVENGAPVASCSEPFFSQYMEGSSNNKSIEIFNPSLSVINLDDYTLIMYNNGGNGVNTYAITGMLASHETYVISHSSSINVADADLVSGGLNHNGDDAYALVKNGVGAVDIIGYFNEDPGSSFAVTGGSTANNTLVRMPSVNAGTTDWNVSMSQWNVLPSNDTTGFGSHDFNPCLVGPIVSFSKDSSTYNEGGGLVNLGSILIAPALVGPTTESFEVHLRASSTGSVADFDVTGLPLPSPITFPITIPLGIFNFTSQSLDITLVDDLLIEGNETVELVLRNAVGINIGADSVIYLKIIDNDFPADTFVELSLNSAIISEGAGSFDIDLDYQQTGVNTLHTVDLELVSGDVADVDNFATMTATFNTLTEKFTVNITDDIIVEGNEVLKFALSNATNGLFIGSDSIFTLTIKDNDVATYALGLVDGNDATGADSAGLHGVFVGVVNSLDRGFNSIEFSIQDVTGSVDVFSDVAPFLTMVVAVGDEVKIEGDIKFDNGMVRIENLVSLNVITSANPLTPFVVTAINDANESDLVRINGLTLVDPAEWFGDNSNAGFDVFATDAAGDTVMIRIDRDYVDLYDATAPNSGVIDVIGVASQYDFSAPYDENHQIIPRDLSDIILYPTLNMDDQGTLVDEDAGTATINFSVANDNGGSYTVDVELTGGSGTADDIDNFMTETAVAVTGGAGSITVNITDDVLIEGNENFEFTLTNSSTGLLIGTANVFDLTINDNDADAIAEINVNALTLYPNPATEKVMLKMISNEKQIANISIVDVIGKTIQSNTFMLNNGENTIELDLTKVAKGNYMVHISTENGNHTENLLVR